MAVRSNIWNSDDKYETRYEGKVLNWYERNGHDDSDWYAEVWNDETKQIEEVLFMTTRCWCNGTAECDATDDVLREVYRRQKKYAAARYDQENILQAKKIQRGDTVRIVKGRKVPKGTEANCFWAGRTYNMYSRHFEDRIGIEVNGERVFIAAENAEPLEWEKRLVRGRERKERIREMAMKHMPISYRTYFEKIRIPA